MASAFKQNNSKIRLEPQKPSKSKKNINVLLIKCKVCEQMIEIMNQHCNLKCNYRDCMICSLYHRSLCEGCNKKYDSEHLQKFNDYDTKILQNKNKPDYGDSHDYNDYHDFHDSHDSHDNY